MQLKKPVITSVVEGIDEARESGVLSTRRPAPQTRAKSFQSSQADVLAHRNTGPEVADDVELDSSIDGESGVNVVKITPENPPPYITTEYPDDEEYVEDDTESYEEGLCLDFS